MTDSALLISPEAPYPLRGGGPMRTAALLHYLARRYAVDALLFQAPGAPDPRAALPPGVLRDSVVIGLPYHSRALPAKAWRNFLRYVRGAPPLNDRFGGHDAAVSKFVRPRRWKVAVIEHFWCAPYCEVVRDHCDRVILDLHNVESVLHERSAATEPWPLSAMHRRFARSARRLERTWLPRYDLVLAASEHDCDLVRVIAGGARAEVLPNSIPPREAPPAEPAGQIVFSGNFEYHPNRAAVRWFARSVWPLLSGRHPGLNWVLLGKNPHAVRRWIAQDRRIVVTGEIEDALPELARSAVAVVPLRSGSGTRVKILEAWAAGAPVVSTPLGAEGLPVRDGEHLLLASTSEEFAAAVTRLLNTPELRWKLRASGRRLYEQHFTWEAVWKRLDSLGI